MKRRLFLLTALWSLVLLPVSAEEKAGGAKPKTVRLLTVGNSFSGNATQYLGAITKAGGNVLIHRQAGIGGGTMQQHWEKKLQHEADPKDPKGFYLSKSTLEQELAKEKWDFVTIQQASIKSHNVETYRPYARLLYDYIRKQAPQAEVVLHQTWEYRSDDPRFKKAPAPGEPGSQQAMHEQLTLAYETIAKELGVRIIPVGDAFHAVDTDPAWGYKRDEGFDPKTAKAPALPKQKHSLHKGWNWKTVGEKTTLGMDGHHANVAGCYLAACVFYEFLFGEDAIGNSYLPKGLEKEEAAYLQKAAHAAVAKRAVKS